MINYNNEENIDYQYYQNFYNRQIDSLNNNDLENYNKLCNDNNEYYNNINFNIRELKDKISILYFNINEIKNIDYIYNLISNRFDFSIQNYDYNFSFDDIINSYNIIDYIKYNEYKNLDYNYDIDELNYEKKSSISLFKKKYNVNYNDIFEKNNFENIDIHNIKNSKIIDYCKYIKNTNKNDIYLSEDFLILSDSKYLTKYIIYIYPEKKINIISNNLKKKNNLIINRNNNFFNELEKNIKKLFKNKDILYNFIKNKNFYYNNIYFLNNINNNFNFLLKNIIIKYSNKQYKLNKKIKNDFNKIYSFMDYNMDSFLNNLNKKIEINKYKKYRKYKEYKKNWIYHKKTLFLIYKIKKNIKNIFKIISYHPEIILILLRKLKNILNESYEKKNIKLFKLISFYRNYKKFKYYKKIKYIVNDFININNKNKYNIYYYKIYNNINFKSEIFENKKESKDIHYKYFNKKNDKCINCLVFIKNSKKIYNDIDNINNLNNFKYYKYKIYLRKNNKNNIKDIIIKKLLKKNNINYNFTLEKIKIILKIKCKYLFYFIKNIYYNKFNNNQKYYKMIQKEITKFFFKIKFLYTVIPNIYNFIYEKIRKIYNINFFIYNLLNKEFNIPKKVFNKLYKNFKFKIENIDIIKKYNSYNKLFFEKYKSIIYNINSEIESIFLKSPISIKNLFFFYKKIINIGKKILKFKNIIISYNIRLVIFFSFKYINKNLILKELVSEGIKGLVKSLEKFKCSLGYKFSTYSSWWIKKFILKFINIKIFNNNNKNNNKNLNRSIYIRYFLENPLSLNTTNNDDDNEDNNNLEELIENKNNLSHIELLKNDLVKKYLYEMFNKLNNKEKDIIFLRNNLNLDYKFNLNKVCQKYNISYEKIKKIEIKIIFKLKKYYVNKYQKIIHNIINFN